MDRSTQLIGRVWELLDDERIVQRLSEPDLSRRLQMKKVTYWNRTRSLQTNLRLATLARYASVLGKRVEVRLVDDGGEESGLWA